MFIYLPGCQAVKREKKNGFQHDIDKKYFNAKWSKAKQFLGMFLHEIMVIKRL